MQTNNPTYYVTPSGNYTIKTGQTMRSTSKVSEFLDWMFKPVVKEAKEKRLKKIKSDVIRIWWSLRNTPEEIRGSFNQAHYNNVLKAKGL